MSVRFISKNIHAFLDYPAALALMFAPLILRIGKSDINAKWLSIVAGIVALILTMFTNHKLGIIRLLSYRFHVFIDTIVGLIFVASPFVLGFVGMDAYYYWALGSAVLIVVSLSDPRSLEVI